MRHNGRKFSSQKSRTKPFVSRRTPPPTAPPARPASPNDARTRTNVPAPPAPATLPSPSRVFLAPAAEPA